MCREVDSPRRCLLTVGGWSARTPDAAPFDRRGGGDGLLTGARERRPAGESAEAPAVPTGSAGDRRSRTATVTNEWAENAPQPNRTIGPSAEARSTRNITGIGAGHRHQDTRDAPQVPGEVGPVHCKRSPRRCSRPGPHVGFSGRVAHWRGQVNLVVRPRASTTYYSGSVTRTVSRRHRNFNPPAGLNLEINTRSG